MRYLALFLGMIISASLLTSCFSSDTKSVIIAQPIPYDIQKKQNKLVNELKRKGVQVVQVGDEVSLRIPDEHIFYPYSAHMRHGTNALFQNIVGFINTYPIEAIQVVGYTDNMGDPLRNLALTRQQAQIVANDLWGRGLNARFIGTEGLGSQMPIASNTSAGGRAKNRHIEILFHLLPPNNVFY